MPDYNGLLLYGRWPPTLTHHLGRSVGPRGLRESECCRGRNTCKNETDFLSLRVS